jgi:hypothetical protein
MTPDSFEYDVALSFAAEDQAAAEELAGRLTERKFRVFLDEYKQGDVWGEDVVDHLVNLYGRKARYCVLLVSRHYPLQKWTEAERRAATERALRDASEYIRPLRLDDSQVPGIPEDPSEHSMENIAELLEEKLAKTRGHPGPPSRSHDLRSGNVPSNGDPPDAE